MQLISLLSSFLSLLPFFPSHPQTFSLSLPVCPSLPPTFVHVHILVTIENRKYSTAVYDKRDNFNFNIVNFPYLSSNIPSGPAYGVYISQLVRIGRICSNYTQFAGRHYKLTQRLIHQGFRYSALCIAFRKFAKKYTQVLEKYGCSIRKHIEDGVCLPATDPFLSRHVSRRSCVH